MSEKIVQINGINVTLYESEPIVDEYGSRRIYGWSIDDKWGNYSLMSDNLNPEERRLKEIHSFINDNY